MIAEHEQIIKIKQEDDVDVNDKISKMQVHVNDLMFVNENKAGDQIENLGGTQIFVNLKESIKSELLEEVKKDTIKLVTEKIKHINIKKEKAKKTDNGLEEIKEEIRDIKDSV